ncbi:exodeoxyribonuclease [Bacillus phage 035JT004]|nr:exodeoxyribonuclease [Bacillus phage 035JT004]
MNNQERVDSTHAMVKTLLDVIRGTEGLDDLVHTTLKLVEVYLDKEVEARKKQDEEHQDDTHMSVYDQERGAGKTTNAIAAMTVDKNAVAVVVNEAIANLYPKELHDRLLYPKNENKYNKFYLRGLLNNSAYKHCKHFILDEVTQFNTKDLFMFLYYAGKQGRRVSLYGTLPDSVPYHYDVVDTGIAYHEIKEELNAIKNAHKKIEHQVEKHLKQ